MHSSLVEVEERRAKVMDRPVDADLLERARTAGGRVSLLRTLKLLSPTVVGLDWQKFDVEFWASQGLEAENFGNAQMYDGADGFVDGDRLQYKIARTSVRRSGSLESSAVFGVFGLAPEGSGVKNVILMVDDRLPSKDWRVFFGTTEELFATAMAVRTVPGRFGYRGLPPLTSGQWKPRVNHVRSLWGGSRGEMTLSSYVEMRFDAARWLQDPLRR